MVFIDYSNQLLNISSNLPPNSETAPAGNFFPLLVVRVRGLISEGATTTIIIFSNKLVISYGYLVATLGDKSSEERNWSPYLTYRCPRKSSSNRHSLTHEIIITLTYILLTIHDMQSYIQTRNGLTFSPKRTA